MNLPAPQNQRAIWLAALVVGLLVTAGFLLGFLKTIAVLFFAALAAAAAYGLQLPEVRERLKNFWENK